MKSARIKEMLKITTISLSLVGMFAAMLLGVNHMTLRAATSGEAYLPQEIEYVNIPDNPVPQPLNLTVIDITQVNTPESPFMGVDRIDPLALSPEAAAAIGAQYIYDIFGVCIDGMYVDMEFTNWSHMTRSHWSGIVSSHNRNTLAQRAEMQRQMDELNAEAAKLHEEFEARVEAGEDPEDVQYIFDALNSRMVFHDFDPGYFHFSIDAITGERVDISRQDGQWIRATRWLDYEEAMARRLAMQAFVERNFDGCWEAATAVNLTPQEVAALQQVVEQIAPMQFVNTAVVSIEFDGAFNFLLIDDDLNVYTRPGNANFSITDETGRVAHLGIDLNTMEVHFITTSRNDIERSVFEDWSEVYANEMRLQS